jgi:ATPase family associated with various cellular activities (AAA)
MIFLLGPPGAGKTTLGSRACKELGLEFLDLAGVSVAAPVDADDLERLSRLVADRAADAIELPWHLQHERKALLLARRSGVLLCLWAHPEEMQARSGHAEPLFTPVPRLKTRGGFGRHGTGCREFRHLDRACGETLLLVDQPLEEAVQVVKECIAEIHEKYDMSPAEREGLASWEDDWRQDHNASPGVSRVIIDAMARYLGHLRAVGASPRTLSGVRSDLNAAGHLVLMYEATKGKRILEYFNGPPREFEFVRKFTDSPALVARYRRSLEGFASFLQGVRRPANG